MPRGFCGLRGRAMQKAVPVGVGAMAALVGTTLDQAKAVAAEAADGASVRPPTTMAVVRSFCRVTKSAVERAVEIAKERGVKRAMMLPVSAPFHCPLMQPAADVMAEALVPG